MKLGRESAARAADALSGTVGHAGTVLVHALDGRVDHLNRRVMSGCEAGSSTADASLADFLFPDIATTVLIRVIGSDGSGRPIAEIRPPISN